MHYKQGKRNNKAFAKIPTPTSLYQTPPSAMTSWKVVEYFSNSKCKSFVASAISEKPLWRFSLCLSLPPTLQCKGKELLSSTQCTTVRGEIEERREEAENHQGLCKNSKLQLLYIKLLLRSQRNDVVESGGVFDGGFDLSAATRRGLIGHLVGKSCRNDRRGHGSI